MKQTTCCAKGCSRPPGGVWADRHYCVRCYRNKQMRDASRRDGKVRPTKDQLNKMFDAAEANGMRCPTCEREMSWLRADGGGAVISLQHDRNGGIRLLCLGCNAYHGQLPGDTWYDLPDGHKRCGKCDRVMPLELFYSTPTTNTGRTANCRECMKAYHREWSRTKRKHATAYERERRKGLRS